MLYFEEWRVMGARYWTLRKYGFLQSWSWEHVNLIEFEIKWISTNLTSSSHQPLAIFYNLNYSLFFLLIEKYHQFLWPLDTGYWLLYNSLETLYSWDDLRGFGGEFVVWGIGTKDWGGGSGHWRLGTEDSGLGTGRWMLNIEYQFEEARDLAELLFFAV